MVKHFLEVTYNIFRPSVITSRITSRYSKKQGDKDNKKGFEETPKPLSALVAGAGLEPATFGL